MRLEVTFEENSRQFNADFGELQQIGVVKGDKGDPGVSATHEWNGTVLTVTSASGTSSADLKGEKGDPGDPGNDGISPTIETEEIDGGTRVTITDINGVKTFDITGGASKEQVEKIIEKYLEENPIDVGVQFETDNTLKLEDGVLSVNTTNLMEQDNTLPITSAGVYATVGNIEALLKTI